jgi:glycosyltransferase involved in cell wall biosynthesis
LLNSSTMQKNPIDLSVSVIVPVKNDSERLGRCLASLNRLPNRPAIVVVDNGSTDGSADVASSMGATTLVCPGLKVGALRNRGVESSNGNVLAFVDSDHEVPEDWMEQALAVLGQGLGVVACGSHYLPPPNGTWVQKVWAIHRLRGVARNDDVEWLGAGNLFVLRSAFEAVGGFREDLVAAEDVDLCHRLHGRSGRIVCDSKIRSIHHGEPKTLRDFIRKEYWRGSSGLKAWALEGFPIGDLPSFLWPLWHLLLGLVAVGFLISIAFHPSRYLLIAMLVNLVLWVGPSILLSTKTCLQEREIAKLPQLAILYFAYGITRAVALFKA